MTPIPATPGEAKRYERNLQGKGRKEKKMNNQDESKYLSEAKARAEYLATAKERMKSMPIEELFMLIKDGSGEISYLAGEEIISRTTGDDEPFGVCKVIMHEYHNDICISCGQPRPTRRK
jgi:hypothetical protein